MKIWGLWFGGNKEPEPAEPGEEIALERDPATGDWREMGKNEGEEQ